MTRGRRPLLTPSKSLHIHLDGQLGIAIDTLLWSDAEGRVPKGAYQQFFTEAAVRYIRQRPLDLSPFVGSLPSEHVVYGFEGTTELLQSTLESFCYANPISRDAVENLHLEGEGERRDADGSGDDSGDRPPP